MTGDEFELMVRRCLEHGVPTNVVAAIFELDRDVVAEARKGLLVQSYGTSDLAEFREGIEFKTLETCNRLLDSGSPSDISRIATTVLGRQIARGAKTVTDTQREAQESIAAKMAAIRGGTPSRTNPGKFVLGPAAHDG